MTLPVCSPELLAQIIEKAPTRIKKKFDKSGALANKWDWVQNNHVWSIRIDEYTCVTISTKNNLLKSLDQVSCSCLLSPKCFHLLAAVSHLPVSDDILEEDPDKADFPEVEKEKCKELTLDQKNCVKGAIEIIASLLHLGIASSGAALHSDLLRCIHTGRCVGLHRLANAGLRTYSLLKSYHSQDKTFFLSDLHQELTEFLDVAFHLSKEKNEELSVNIGSARRQYKPCGNIKLTGLFSEAIITRLGQVGVVSHFIDKNGSAYSLPTIKPKSLQDIQTSYMGGVDLGDVLASHSELVRSGLLLHDATVSEDKRLGRGKKVKAVLTDKYNDQLFNTQFDRSLSGQLSTLKNNVNGMIYIKGNVCGGDQNNLYFHESSSENIITLSPPSNLHIIAQKNLHLLSQYGGLSLRVVCRLDPLNAGTMIPLLVTPDLEKSDELFLPESYKSRCMITLDRIEESYLNIKKTKSRPIENIRATDFVFDVLKRNLDRILLNGRHALGRMSASSIFKDKKTLEQYMLNQGSQYLDALIQACREAQFDATGKRIFENHFSLVNHWAMTNHYVRSCQLAFVKKYWNIFIREN